jgi:hypothetical protein
MNRSRSFEDNDVDTGIRDAASSISYLLPPRRYPEFPRQSASAVRPILAGVIGWHVSKLSGSN